MGKSLSRLWVTEKPEMARNLCAGICSAFGVKVVNQSTASRDGYMQLSSGDRVSYFFGHLLASAPPAAYMTKEQAAMKPHEYFKFLPLRVKKFKYEPKPEMKAGKVVTRDGKPVAMKQVAILTKLFREAKEIVNAGDVDREGQLIVDEFLEYVGIDPQGGTKPIWRLPLVSAKEEDIRKQVLALSERNGDRKWVLRRHAAMARAYCDWGLGINASMAQQAVTGYRRMSVGRVQTPVVALVVERDDQIASFKPQNYFVPVITLADGTVMRWHKRENAAGTLGFDMQGRIIDEAVAKRMCTIIASGMAGRVNIAKSERKDVAPPMPFSASVLASTVAKRYGVSPKEAEKAAQSLYEKHKAISYVGTDCQFLPQSYLENARSTLAMISKTFPRQAAGANPELVSKAWNDDKVDEHHAIIPTASLPSGVSELERAVYETVAKRYMAQFYPSYQYIKSSLGAVFGGDEFRAVTQEAVRMGWREAESDHEMGGRDTQAVSDENDDDEAESQRKVERDV